MSRITNINGTLSSYAISPQEFQQRDRFGYKVCAIIWDEDTWCAYRETTDKSDGDVISYGSEIPYEVAAWLFPTLAHNIKRYGGT